MHSFRNKLVCAKFNFGFIYNYICDLPNCSLYLVLYTNVDMLTVLSGLFSLGEENKTRAGGFGHRTDMPQRQQKIDPEHPVQQKSANVKELLFHWQSKLLSSGKDKSQNMSASELSKTESTTLNHLQNVPATGGPPDQRLKKAYSMNNLHGSDQQKSTFSRLHITSYMYFRCGEIYTLLRNILDVIILLIFK